MPGASGTAALGYVLADGGFPLVCFMREHSRYIVRHEVLTGTDGKVGGLGCD